MTEIKNPAPGSHVDSDAAAKVFLEGIPEIENLIGLDEFKSLFTKAVLASNPPPAPKLEGIFAEALKILNGLAIAYGSLPTSITGPGSWHSHAVAFLDRHRTALAAEGPQQ